LHERLQVSVKPELDLSHIYKNGQFSAGVIAKIRFSPTENSLKVKMKNETQIHRLLRSS